LAREGRGAARLRTQVVIGAAMAVAIVVSLAAVLASQLDRPGEESLTPAQRAVILKLQSVLLHDSVTPQYARVSLEPDARGYVSGIGDFATADGSALKVIDAYTARVGTNVLSRDYGATLAQLARERSPDTSQLDGYPEAWRAASRDPVFQQVQDNVLQASYLEPAIAKARAQGVRSALGIAIFFDTILQHGDSSGPDSLSAVVTRTNATAPSTPDDEHAWLDRFLKVREEVLLNPAEPRHQRLWPLTVTRIRVLAELVRAGNWDLTPPIRVNPYGTAHYLDASPPTVTLPSLTRDPPSMTTSDVAAPSSTPTAATSRPAGGAPPGPTTGAPTVTSPPASVAVPLVGSIIGIDGVCLDLNNARIDTGHIKTWVCNGTNAQIWSAETNGTLSITITPPPDPGVLETACARPRNRSAAPGTELELVACDPGDATQQWRFENGHIRNVGTDKCISVVDQPDYYGRPVIMATCADVSRQIWSLPH
jgi:chitosanase